MKINQHTHRLLLANRKTTKEFWALVASVPFGVREVEYAFQQVQDWGLLKMISKVASSINDSLASVADAVQHVRETSGATMRPARGLGLAAEERRLPTPPARVWDRLGIERENAMNAERMMWCWPLEITDYQEIPMPADAKLVCCRLEGDTPYLWVTCNRTLLPVGARGVLMVTSGEAFTDSGRRYIDTFQVPHESTCYHVFECEVPEEELRQEPVEEQAANPTHHECSVCGYAWKHGTHGGHHCISRLKERCQRLTLSLSKIEQWFREFPVRNIAGDENCCYECRFWTRINDCAGKCKCGIRYATALPPPTGATTPNFGCILWRSKPAEDETARRTTTAHGLMIHGLPDRALGDGVYDGFWGGYEVKFTVNDRLYSATTKDGIRAPRAPCLVTYIGGRMTVALTKGEGDRDE